MPGSENKKSFTQAYNAQAAVNEHQIVDPCFGHVAAGGVFLRPGVDGFPREAGVHAQVTGMFLAEQRQRAVEKIASWKRSRLL